MASDFSTTTGFAGTIGAARDEVFPPWDRPVQAIQETLFKAAGSM